MYRWNRYVVLGIAATALATRASGQTVTAEWLNPVNGFWVEAWKWSTNPQYPNSNSYDVHIDSVGADYEVELFTTLTVHDLTLDSPAATLEHTGGNLTVEGALNLNAGRYVMTSGTLLDATISINGGQFLSGGNATLSNITFRNDNPANIGGFFKVYDGMTLDNSVLRLTGGSGFVFAGTGATRILDGTGEIYFDNTFSGTVGSEFDTSMIVGSGIAIRTGTSGGSVGFGNNLINQGVISAQTENATLLVAGNWHNEGLINLSAGTLKLGGSFTTAGIGNLQRSGGTVAITGTLNNTASTLLLNSQTGSWYLGTPAGDANLTRGRIIGGVVSAADGAQLIIETNDSSLKGVTLDADLSLSSVRLFIEDHLNVAANRSLTLSGGTLDTDNPNLPPAILGGSGEIILNAGATPNRISSDTSTQIIIGPDLTIRTGTGGGIIGGSGSSPNHGLLTNHGTISVETPGQSITVQGEWSNAGTLRVTDGTLLLDGRFSTSDIGTIERIGGTVKLGGMLDNSGATLHLNATTGSWEMRGGNARITGGSVVSSDGAKLIATPGPSTFEDVNMDVDIDVLGSASITFHDVTLSNARRISLMGSTATLRTFTGIDGSGEIVLGGASGQNHVYGESGDMVIGSGIAIRTGSRGGRISADGTISFENHGTISSETSGHAVNIGASSTRFYNLGLLRAINGGTLTLEDADNNGTIELDGGTLNTQRKFRNDGTISASESVLNLAGNDWINAGDILATDTTLNLGGTFRTSSAGSIARSGGQTNIVGELNNSSDILELDAFGGSWNLAGGKIFGGTVSAVTGGLTHMPVTADSRLEVLTLNGGIQILNNASVFMRGVTLAESPVIATDRGTLEWLEVSISSNVSIPNNVSIESTGNVNIIDNGQLTLEGSASPLDPLRLQFSGNHRLAGTGSVIFDHSANTIIHGTGSEITIDRDITLRTGTGGATLGGDLDALINRGTISAQTAGKSILINPSIFTNGGSVEARNGGTVIISNSPDADLVNLSGTTLTGGSWRVFDNSNLIIQGSPAITRNAATIELSGPGSVFIPVDSLQENAGTLFLSDGRDFTTTGSFQNNGNLSIDAESTLFVTEDFSQGMTNTLLITLSGTGPNDFGIVEINGHASLAGRLRLRIGNDPLFSADMSDTFQIMTFGSSSGEFTQVSGREYGSAGLYFDPVYDADSVTLVIRQADLGDSDFDGDVDIEDLKLLATSYGAQSAARWSHGDYDGDGDVDIADLGVLATHYSAGQAQAMSDFQRLVSVPEPGTVSVFFGAMLWASRRQRRIRR